MAGLDYGAAIRAGQSLVPDMRAQLFRQEQMDMARQEFDWRREQMDAARQAQIVESQEQAAFREQLEQALLSNDPQAIMRLMARFPKMAEGIKPLWESMDERQRAADLTQIGTIYARGNAGDLEGAAAALRARVEADRAAGAADPADEAILAGLESNDPIQQRAALATVGIQLAALTGDKFSETYGKLNPTTEPTQVQKLADYYRSINRPDLAQQVIESGAIDLVTVEPGGSVYNKADFASGGAAQPRGGDLSALGGVPAPELGPNGIPASLTPEQYQAVVAAKGKQTTDEWMARNGVTVSGGPVQVRTKQQYDKLAPGTPYIAPDGSQRVKS